VSKSIKNPVLLTKGCQKNRALNVREAAAKIRRGASRDASGLTAKSITVRLWMTDTETDDA